MSVLQGRRRVWAWGRVFSEQALQDLRGKEYLHPFSRKGEGRRRSGGAAATKQASLFPRQIKHRPSRFHLTTAPESSGAVVRLFVKQVAPAQLPEAPHVVRPAGSDFGLRSSGKDHFTDIPHADELFEHRRKKLIAQPQVAAGFDHIFQGQALRPASPSGIRLKSTPWQSLPSSGGCLAPAVGRGVNENRQPVMSGCP